MSLKKLSIVSEIKFISYKILDMESVNLTVSVWSSRDMNEETYLGEAYVKLKDVFDKPNEWAVNNKFKLSAEEFEKHVKGLLFLQVKWTPED